MVMLGFEGSSAISMLWEAPGLAVRVIEDEDTRSDRSTGLVGDIRTDLVPLQYSMLPGSTGGTLSLRVHEELFIQSGRYEDAVEKWQGKTVTLEARNTSNRALQEVRFKGKMIAITKGYAPDDNGVTLHIGDFWHQAADAPVAMPTQGKTVGRIATEMAQGFYFEPRATSSGVINQVNYFPQYLFPRDADGNDIAGIDETLLESTVYPGECSFRGQKFNQAFAELVRRAYGMNRIPDIEYEDRGFVRMLARERGGRVRELVVGSPGAVDPTYTKRCEVLSITGNFDYQRVNNRAVGFGSPTREIEPMDMEKGWTDAEETAVSEDPTLNHSVRYHHVFRRYKAPRAFWQMASSPQGFGTDDSLDDQPTFWRRKLVEGAGVDSGWIKARPSFKIRRERTTGETQGAVIDDLTDVHPEDARMLSIYFDDPQRFGYYTSASQTLRNSGCNGGGAALAGYDFQFEAVRIGPRVAVDTGFIGGDVPRLRTIYVENEDIVKYDYERHFTVNSDGTRTEAESAESWMLRDDSSGFLGQLTNLIEESKRVTADVRVVLWYYQPEWRLGDRVDRLVSNIGETLFSNLEWHVNAIYHDLQAWRTELHFSNARQDFTGAMLNV